MLVVEFIMVQLYLKQWEESAVYILAEIGSEPSDSALVARRVHAQFAFRFVMTDRSESGSRISLELKVALTSSRSVSFKRDSFVSLQYR